MISNISGGPLRVRLRMLGVLHIVVKYSIAPLVKSGHCRTQAGTWNRQAVAKITRLSMLTTARPDTMSSYSCLSTLYRTFRKHSMCQCRRKKIWTFQRVTRCTNSQILIQCHSQLAVMKVCEYKFPIKRSLGLPLCRYTATNRCQQTVTPYRGFAILCQESWTKCCL